MTSVGAWATIAIGDARSAQRREHEELENVPAGITLFAVMCFLSTASLRVCAQAPIDFGVSQDYGGVYLGLGQMTIIENPNNSDFQMRVDTHFIANDGSDLIRAVSVSKPPHGTNEIRFTPPLLPRGCTTRGSVSCNPETFRVRAVAIVTTGQIKPPLDDMCDTFLSTQSMVGAAGTLFVLTPIWTHAWPGAGQLKSPDYSLCRGPH
jgi:hypothetical protein